MDDAVSGAGHAARRAATDFGPTRESPQGSYVNTFIRIRPTESRARRTSSDRRPAMAMRRIGSLLLLAMLAVVARGYSQEQAPEPSALTMPTLGDVMKFDVVSINVLA